MGLDCLPSQPQSFHHRRSRLVLWVFEICEQIPRNIRGRRLQRLRHQIVDLLNGLDSECSLAAVRGDTEIHPQTISLMPYQSGHMIAGRTYWQEL